MGALHQTDRLHGGLPAHPNNRGQRRQKRHPPFPSPNSNNNYGELCVRVCSSFGGARHVLQCHGGMLLDPHAPTNAPATPPFLGKAHEISCSRRCTGSGAATLKLRPRKLRRLSGQRSCPDRITPLPPQGGIRRGRGGGGMGPKRLCTKNGPTRFSLL